ncbi:DUF2126 domain-containing protein [Agaribacterium haliotis]|uniref:transglutaminase family protein n=1 Tax=Agaribacterium haliotis TaxID=2013869 RepID=UPI000BB551C3|nr:transglutaminase family protein [Agaribacterium haliotis]
MTIRVAISHKTYYDFDRLVNLSAHTIRLRPAPHCRTPIHSYSLNIEPKQHFVNWQQDALGNYQASVVFPEKCRRLAVEVEVIADMVVINPFDFFLEEKAEHFPFTYDDDLKKDLAPYLELEACGPLFKALLADLPLANAGAHGPISELKQEAKQKKMRSIDWLVAVNQQLQGLIKYSIRMEPGVQTPEQTLEKKLGSCRDSSWLLVQLLRHRGLAARFVSGYLVQLSADEKSLDGPSGPESDFTDLHAWCEVFLPGAGWVGLDPTSGLFAGEGHIPLACTPRPSSAAPISGATDKCEVEFSFSNEVARIHEDPRVTRPYDDSEWQNILALGDSIDQQMLEQDIRLTMGGEPTFVSIDDMESAQWNTEALGEDKLALAKSLLLRLRDHFAPQALLHYGQGKWYPGEEVPRWALGLFWRKDGEALWREPKLLARIDSDLKHDINTAERFAHCLLDLIGIDERFLQPAYEDALHYLLEQQQLPLNIDQLAMRVSDDLGRRRLARLLERKFSEPVGFVLPLEWDAISKSWQTSAWPLRRERLILTPGDSPLGLRLPLAQLPESAEQPFVKQRDPGEPCEPLQKRIDIRLPFNVREIQQNEYRADAAGQQAGRQVGQEPGDKPSKKSPPEPGDEGGRSVNVIRTALCIEVRGGKLHIFMPPLYALENYVELLVALETAAERCDTPLIIEGYEPPKDARLQKLLVTPDPGVIEVNVHPSSSWRELISTTTELYHAARQSRLAAEKFMLDGRHTGTGGGNHITLGGASPADSPLLRRPDLLRSFVSFWQHHPSLSYVFSGSFIGPTSQAPRVDEGRDEMLYELETAFQQVPEGLAEQPWLVDRLFRNLLIDITGNTHRAEFCIDKLFAPGSASGRLGILEFRGFEMPPHSRMALVQALLIRALLLRFWKTPYKQPLVRWGTSLHDKFMLPHYLWADLKEVVEDLNRHGLAFDLDWLKPFQAFRFPCFGRQQFGDIHFELHWAIEPWHVLGEEIGSFGTARYVDSSVERVQVKLSGLTDSRYVLACNGRRVPLQATGKQGEFVAAVRYRAWAPPSALHPTIGVHVPLHFDLIDCWNGRSVGGCTYHVSHEGGRSYDSFPVNAMEAEARRVNRFSSIGHTQGPFVPRPQMQALREFFPNQTPPQPMSPPPEEAADEYPHTLDLRRSAAPFI